MRAQICRTGVAVAVALCLWPGSAAAQQNVEFNGRVTDPDGLVLPGATVTVTHVGTGLTRTVVTGSTGGYVIGQLPPGTYDVVVEMPGFATIRREAVPVPSGSQVTFDFQLPLRTVEETISVTAASPLVERTSNRLGATLGTREIEEVPSNFRNFTALTQLVPGMTPQPATSTFEGGGVTANGSPGQSNLFLIDGLYNNDDRLGAGPGAQVRMVLDNIAEYQVLGNQYSVEYGGAAGAIINMVSRSGTNSFSGRVYNYFRDDKLHARSAFLSAGFDKPDERTLQTGFSLGGPIVRDRAHFYVTVERDDELIAGLKTFPAEAAPLARDFIGAFEVEAFNYFTRGDLQLSPNHFLSARWVLETAPALGEGFNTNSQLEDAKDFESDWDQVHNLSLTSVLGDRGSNQLRLGRIGEQLGTGAKTFFKDTPSQSGFHRGLDGRDQFGIGSSNSHSAYTAGPGGGGANNVVRTYMIDNTYSYFLPTGHGDHTFKLGGGMSLNRVRREIVDSGTFIFNTDLPYDPANPATYPRQFEIIVGPEGLDSFDAVTNDRRGYFFVEDRWQPTGRVTLNLGLRYDNQRAVPDSKRDFAPRVGFVYDLTGDGATVFRAGVGQFYAYTPTALDIAIQQQGVITQFPEIVITDPNNPVLRPDMVTDSAGNPGVAQLSAAGVAELRRLRDAVLAGTTFNRNPRFDSPGRKMPYTLAWSAGVARELGPSMAVTVDYVANVGRNQLGLVDINEPINGVRPGVDVFDPNGELVPAVARGVNFNRVLQAQTRKELESEYKSLQVSLVKRFSNRWSMRHAYTLQDATWVGLGNPNARRVWLDNDIRADRGRFAFNRRHVLAMSGTANPVGNLTIAGVVSATSGRPYNETTGLDGNRDGDRTDRPIQGIDDRTLPIRSPVDDQGRAVINGLDGPSYVELNLSVRYAIPIQGRRNLDLSWDMYNVTNRLNYNLPVGNRRSSNFMKSTSVQAPRQMQLGVRFRF